MAVVDYELIVGSGLTLTTDDVAKESTIALDTVLADLVAGTSLSIDTIVESTLDNGVSVEGVVLKDSGGTFATLTATTVDINGGAIDGTVIGGDTPAAVTGTNITATGSVNIGTGGTYAEGSIYSDASWGMIFRAKQALPGQADFRWANSADVEFMRIPPSTGNLLIGATSEPSTASRLVSKASTADGSTDGIVVQDSAGTEVFAVDSDGNIKQNNISNPNILINTDLTAPINQEGVDITTGYAPTTGDYTVDMWKVTHGVTTPNLKQETGLRLTVTTAGAGTSCILQQLNENPTRYLGMTVTLQAKVKSNTTDAFIQVTDGPTATAAYHSGGGGFEILTVTHTLSGVGTVLRSEAGLFNAGGLSDGNYVEVEWIKLEEGAAPTPWTVPDPQQELARCQRYFVRLNSLSANLRLGMGMAYNTVTAAIFLGRPKMRTGPSVSSSGTFQLGDGTSTVTATGLSLDSNGDFNTIVTVNVASGLTAGQHYQLWGSTSADYIDLDSRL